VFFKAEMDSMTTLQPLGSSFTTRVLRAGGFLGKAAVEDVKRILTDEAAEREVRTFIDGLID